MQKRSGKYYKIVVGSQDKDRPPEAKDNFLNRKNTLISRTEIYCPCSTLPSNITVLEKVHGNGIKREVNCDAKIF